MTSFNKFIKSVKTGNSLLSKNDAQHFVEKSLSSVLMPNSPLSSVAYKFDFSDSEIKKFAKEVSQLVYSDDFLNEFSDKIGKPKDNESEDEFVSSAKKTMKKLLSKKLSK